MFIGEKRQANLQRIIYRESSRRTGVVYVVQFGYHDAVKIGYAHVAKKRIALLQTGTPIKLRTVLTLPGTPLLERTLHRVLERWRFRGEWFRTSPEVLATIAWLEQIPIAGRTAERVQVRHTLPEESDRGVLLVA